MTIFYLLRHGQTYANQKGILQGCLNTSLTYLTPAARQATQRYQNFLDSRKIDQVFSSPLIRAVQTSQIICHHDPQILHFDNRLTELSYGQWNGMALTEIKQRFARYFDSFFQEVVVSSSEISQGESFAHAQARVYDFLQTQSVSFPQQRLLLVTHGWIIKTIVAHCFEQVAGNIFLTPANLSVTKIEITPGNSCGRVIYFNQF